MLRTRSGWLLAAVAAFGLGSAACKKDGDKAGGGGAAALSGGTSDLSLLPADSDVVAGINFSQMMSSALFKQYATPLLANATKELGEFKAACGFDPMESLKSASIGMKNLDGNAPTGTAVIHGPDKAKVIACLKSDKLKAEMDKQGTSFVEDGGVYLIKDKGGSTPAAMTFVSDDTMLMAFGDQGVTKDTVLAAAKGGSALKTSPAFVEMFGKINTKDTLWVLVNGNAAFLQKAQGMGIKPKAVFGSVNVTDGLSLDMRVRLATPEEAKNLVDMGKQQTSNEQVKQMFDKLDLTADGADAKISVAMSKQKLEQMAQLFGGMLGGMMGGMGGGGMGGGPALDDQGAGGATP